MKTYTLRSIGKRRLMEWSGFSPSSFYYKRSGTPKGLRPSTHSVNQHSELLENQVVVKDIERTLTQEFCCYGYRNMTAELIDHSNINKIYQEF